MRQRHLALIPHWVLRGIWEMLRARRRLAQVTPQDIHLRNDAIDRQFGGNGAPANPAQTLDRVAFIIPWLGRWLPWRSDCLVQAMAGQNWLAQGGLPSTIKVGVDASSREPFGAHAWLICEGRIVTGGNIDRYAILVGDASDRDA